MDLPLIKLDPHISLLHYFSFLEHYKFYSGHSIPHDPISTLAVVKTGYSFNLFFFENPVCALK